MEDKALVNKKFQRNSMIIELLPLGGMIAVIALFGVLTGGGIFSAFNLKAIWSQCFLYIIGGLGMSFLFAQGAVDLSAGSVIALASIFGATAVNSFGIAGGFIVCVLIGLACGTFVGWLYSHTDIAVFILGLSVSFLIKGVLFRITDGQASIAIPNDMKRLFTPTWVSVVVVIIMFLIMGYLFNFTIMGKHSRAIGAGGTSALQSGVKVTKIKWLAFIISGITTGIVAFMTMMKTGSGGPSTGTSFEFNVMIAMILGGMPSEGGAKANIKACFIGAVLISFYTNGMVMMNVDSRLSEIIKGVVFIVVVVAVKKLQTAAGTKKEKISKVKK